MTKSIALLSGKGGSGKTTIALSIASLLSECNIRCLLIDCDFSTNGATFFYEKKLAERKYLSFYNIITDKTYITDFVTINEYLSFLPSVPSLEQFDTSNLSFDSNAFFKINSFMQEAASKYDIFLTVRQVIQNCLIIYYRISTKLFL